MDSATQEARRTWNRTNTPASTKNRGRRNATPRRSSQDVHTGYSSSVVQNRKKKARQGRKKQRQCVSYTNGAYSNGSRETVKNKTDNNRQIACMPPKMKNREIDQSCKSNALLINHESATDADVEPAEGTAREEGYLVRMQQSSLELPIQIELCCIVCRKRTVQLRQSPWN